MIKYRILAMDGGGIRGLLTTVILEQLDERVPGWRDQIQLLAGTSSGGLIALGLAHRQPPRRLRRLFEEEAPLIFRDSVFDNLRDLGRLFGADYSNRNLRRILDTLFEETRLGDFQTRVLIPAFDLDNEAEDESRRCWKPKFFHNFPGRDSDGNARAADVALYTSAAPSYFPSADGYIDGGVVVNNPALAAVTQVLDRRARVRNRPALEEISVLSVGTGKVLSTLSGDRLDWGIGQWARPLLRLMLDGSLGVVDYQCERLLGDHYQRINPTFPPDQGIALDAVDKIPELLELGERGMQRELDRTARWLQRHWMD